MISRGLVGSLCVLVGGWVLSTLPESTPMLRHHLLVEARSHQWSRMVALAVVLIGLGLLAHSWLRLRSLVARARDQAESLSLVRFATVLWAAPLIIAPPLFSRDGWSYAAQGALVAAGISPYQHGPWILEGPVHEAVDPLWWFTPTPYGPLPVWWGAEMAHHTGNPLMLAIGHRLLALVGLALLAWAMPRLARWTGVNPAVATAVVIASPAMMANGVGGLHNDLLMVGLMAAALVIGVERHWALGAVIGGLAAAVKLPGGLVCVGIVLATVPVGASLWKRGLRAAEIGAIALVVLFGLGFVSGLGSGWLKALGVPGTVNTMVTPAVVLGMPLDGLASLLGLHLGHDFFIDALRKVGTLITVVVFAGVFWRWPSGDRAKAVSAVALMVSVLVICSPIVHLWYLLWPVPFLVVVPMTRGPRITIIVGLIVSALVAPLDPSLHSAYKVIAMTITLVALAVGAVAGARWLSRREITRPSWFVMNREGR